MTTVRQFTHKTKPEEIKFGKLELAVRSRSALGEAKLSQYDQIQVYRAALGNDDKIHLLDVIAPSGEIQALRAALGKSVNSGMKFYGCSPIGQYRNPEKCEHGYRFHMETVGGRMGGKQLVHFIAISNQAGFMPYVTPDSLAKCLGSNAFTTPFLCPAVHGDGVPDWMPYITEKLAERKTLTYLDSFNCNAAILLQRENEIENIISTGVKDKSLPWVPYDLAEITAAKRDAEPKKPARKAVVIANG